MTTQSQRPFGNFHATCTNDKLRPVMMHGIIRKGAIWTTDSHLMVKSDLDLWSAIEPNSIPMAEGKVLHRDKLKKMSSSKVKKISFEDDGVSLYTSHSSAQADEFLRYDAKYIGMDDKRPELLVWLDAKGEMMLNDKYDEKIDKDVLQKYAIFSFPNLEAVIPSEFLSGKECELYPITPELRFSPLLLNDIFNCFAEDGSVGTCYGVSLLKFHESNTRPIMVLPLKSKFREEGYLKQFGLMMPVVGL